MTGYKSCLSKVQTSLLINKGDTTPVTNILPIMAPVNQLIKNCLIFPTVFLRIFLDMIKRLKFDLVQFQIDRLNEHGHSRSLCSKLGLPKAAQCAMFLLISVYYFVIKVYNIYHLFFSYFNNTHMP